MKFEFKYLLFASILMCGMTSCTKSENAQKGLSVVKFSASFDETKIVRDDKGKSLWEEGDAIDIFYNVGTYFS